MTKVLLVGAGRGIAPHLVRMLGASPGVDQTLLVPDIDDVPGLDDRDDLPTPPHIVEGRLLDRELLDKTLADREVVVADLDGEVDAQVETLVDAMRVVGVRRLVLIATFGVADELTGPFGESVEEQRGDELTTWKTAVETAEKSGLDLTVLRPAWLTDGDELDHETTLLGEEMTGTEVSRKAVASLCADIVRQPDLHSGRSVGVGRPGPTALTPTED